MRKNKDVVRVTPPEGLVASRPDYMADAPHGVETLSQFLVPPRIKVVQKTADPALLEQFNEGDVILMPSKVLVAEMIRDNKGHPSGKITPFYIVPVFFFPEWCSWNPIQLKGQGPAVRERSLDIKSSIAQKARSQSTRYEPHPDKKDLKIRHVEHLNFVSVLVGDHPYAMEPFIVSFSRGEHGAGRRFAQLVKMRKAPLYGCIFEINVGFRQNTQGNWWGLDVGNPPAAISPWVSAEAFPLLKEMHETFVQHHKNSLIRVDYDPEEEVPPIDDSPPM